MLSSVMMSDLTDKLTVNIPTRGKKNAHFSDVIFFPTSFRFSTCSNIQIQTRVSQLHHSINSRRILHVSGITSDHKIQFDRSDMVQKI